MLGCSAAFSEDTRFPKINGHLRRTQRNSLGTSSMVTVVFVSRDGTERVMEGETGATVMSLAVSKGLDGIVGECGGYCNCATCHVYLLGEWAQRVTPVAEHEDAMLDGTVSERLPNSRLSCQLVLGPELDGITVALPERQTV
jgi:2Fe-2S ferredoxin